MIIKLRAMFLVLFVIALGGISAQISAEIYYPVDYDQNKRSEKPFMIAWDVHNVLAQKEKTGKTMKFIYAVSAAPLALAYSLLQIAWSKITGYQTVTSLAQADMSRLPASALSSGEAYIEIFLKYGLNGLARMVSTLSSSYVPNQQVLAIVRDLNSQGMTQRYASNIGPRLLNDLKIKFNYENTGDELESIQEGKIVDYSKYGAGAGQPAAHLATVGKPDPAFFDQFNKQYNPTTTNQIVFIDDSRKNAQESTKAGWIGIYFDHKNDDAITLLEEDLNKLGISITYK